MLTKVRHCEFRTPPRASEPPYFPRERDGAICEGERFRIWPTDISMVRRGQGASVSSSL